MILIFYLFILSLLLMCPVMAFQSQGSTLRGPVAVASGSALYKGLGNGPSSSSAPLYRYRPPGAASGQPGRQAANQTPLPGRPPPQTTSAPGPTPGTAHQAHPRSQAGQSSCQLTGRRVRPGVTAATTLTLAAASHWLAGPSLGLMHRQDRCHYRARPRERQALIRECLGQNSQSPPR